MFTLNLTMVLWSAYAHGLGICKRGDGLYSTALPGPWVNLWLKRPEGRDSNLTKGNLFTNYSWKLDEQETCTIRDPK